MCGYNNNIISSFILYYTNTCIPYLSQPPLKVATASAILHIL